MAIHADSVEEALRTITLPPGPALLYVTEGDNPTITVLDRADPDLMRHRDRAICRALLVYVVEDMDTP
ncbi:hypothetical protein OG884_18675 [Streptosporangium sp. NBC_01755]|uniref:hypothetical protein n=1 Tax=unclassified Streptosporangium TaxID=2632669 RepID=UPI002DDA57C0|nr:MULTISPECIES: hypothetical protein [unclassified Streptosporangium]WSA23707.1 hypothetical protein OIE13_22460 [Streptosporangium sp. NBC_01810]WSD03833.1 hypothetical protein OG884_18675 [Streptosporangium sp. NBC_01755]